MKNETELAVPSDLAKAIKDIKLAILQARAKAARLANAEALKLYFFVGGYISKKTRNAKWGSGAIDALSKHLQVELPGLRGFTPTNIKNMRVFFEAWAIDRTIRQLATAEFGDSGFRHLPTVELHQENSQKLYLSALDATMKHPDENPSIGLLLCEKMNKGFVEFAVRDKSKPLGIATYKTLKSIPKPYQTFAPVIEGVKRILTENAKANVPQKNTKRKGAKK